MKGKQQIMKKLIIAIAILAMALTACGNSQPSATPPASNPNGTVIYSTDFSKNDKNWDEGKHNQDEIRIRDGQMTINVQTTNWDLWTNPNDLKVTDYVVVDVDVQRIAGPEDGTYGIICDYQDLDTYYGLILADDGYAEIYRWVGGQYETLASQQGVSLNPGAMNHLTAYCGTSNLSLSVNGITVLEAPGKDLGTGNVGLIAGAFDPSNVQFAFDNFVVSTLP
jgi:predicted small lipoprotein YifL